MKSFSCLLALFYAVPPTTSSAQEFRKPANINRRLPGSGWLLLVVLSFGITSPAQDIQRFEAFGGYSFTHDSGLGWLDLNSNFSGWDSSSTVFLNRWFGVTADFSGHYGSKTEPVLYLGEQPTGKVKNTASSYTYLFGPHFTYRRSRYAPFAESLFGLHNPRERYTILESPDCPPPSNCTGLPVGSGGGGSYHKFAMAIGGGLDIALSHGISFRPFEVDYLLLRKPSEAIENGNFVFCTANNNAFRYSTGITFSFGPHLKPPK
jgi:hypothetical protein